MRTIRIAIATPGAWSLQKAIGMYRDQDQLDEQLKHLADLLRNGDVMMACLRLGELASELDRVMRHEEREIAFAYVEKVKNEHASIRRLIGLIAFAIDSADERRGLHMIAQLRSVLMVHVAKEESLRVSSSL